MDGRRTVGGSSSASSHQSLKAEESRPKAEESRPKAEESRPKAEESRPKAAESRRRHSTRFAAASRG